MRKKFKKMFDEKNSELTVQHCQSTKILDQTIHQVFVKHNLYKKTFLLFLKEEEKGFIVQSIMLERHFKPNLHPPENKNKIDTPVLIVESQLKVHYQTIENFDFDLERIKDVMTKMTTVKLTFEDE